MKTTNTNTGPGFAWAHCGGALLGLTVSMAWLSRVFVYGSPMGERPIPLLVALLFTAGLVYCATLFLGRGSNSTPKLMTWIFLVGLAMRLCYFASTPILEDDYYRYLWDGAVTASGHNPYAHSPESVQLMEKQVPDTLLDLGMDAGQVLDRVNHPELTTVYPPVAQGAFAMAHVLVPWSITGLRILYLILDCISFLLLLHLLSQCFKPFWLITVYWWNPLLIKEAFNSVHMDLLLVPCLALLALLVLQRRYVVAQLPLVAAIGIKVWPILLLPLLFAPLLKHPVALMKATLLLLLLGCVLILPLYPLIQPAHDSGFSEYATRWEMNDALFMAFPWVVEKVDALLNLELTTPTTHRMGRILVALLCVIIALVVGLRTRKHPDRFNHAALIITATLFLLSPTQFPWYAFWLFPFLMVRPVPGLLLLTPMLSLYYLRFYYTHLDQADFFHNRVVWVEYAPVFLVLVLSWMLSLKAKGNKKVGEGVVTNKQSSGPS